MDVSIYDPCHTQWFLFTVFHFHRFAGTFNECTSTFRTLRNQHTIVLILLQWCVGNLLFDTSMLRVCQGPLNATGHPAHTWPRRGTLTLPFCLLVTLQTGNSLPSPGKLLPGSFWADWNKALTQVPPDTSPIRDQSHLHLHHHLKSGGKRSTQKSCKTPPSSPKIH